MKKLLMSIAAAATLLTAAPAVAQVGIYAGERGVGIEVGRDRDYYRHYGWDRGRHYGWYRERGYRGCRTVTVRERMWDGTVVVRTRERC